MTHIDTAVFLKYSEINKQTKIKTSANSTETYAQSFEYEEAAVFVSHSDDDIDSKDLIDEFAHEEIEDTEEITEEEIEESALISDEEEEGPLGSYKKAAQDLKEALEESGGQFMKSSSSGITDPTGLLAKRLVAAEIQFAVHQVIGEANKALINLRMALASCSPEDAVKIRGIIKKLDKLVSKGQAKVQNLQKEDVMRRQAQKAQQKKQEKRAEEIKKELRAQMKERKRKERKYLKEAEEPVKESGAPQQKLPGTNSQDKLDASSEAQIEMEAEAQAAAEATVGTADVSGAAEGVAAEGAAVTEGADVSTGAEGGGADAGGAEAAAPAAE